MPGTLALKAPTCLILLVLACGPGALWAEDQATAPNPAPAPMPAPTAEELPYGTGYEARQAARTISAEPQQAAATRPDKPARAATGSRDRAASKGADRPRSSNRPPRPERTR